MFCCLFLPVEVQKKIDDPLFVLQIFTELLTLSSTMCIAGKQDLRANRSQLPDLRNTVVLCFVGIDHSLNRALRHRLYLPSP